MSSVAADGTVLSGIDLLMNQSKKRAAGDAASVSSSISSAISNAAASRKRAASLAAASAAVSERSQASSMSFQPPDATVPRPGQAQSPSSSVPSPPPFFYNKPPQFAEENDEEEEEEDDEEDEGNDEDDDDDDDDEEEDDDDDSSIEPVRQMRPEEIANAKRDVLYQFDRIERKGVRLPRRFTMNDDLHEMRAELDRLKLDREVDVSIQFQRKILMTCVTGIELLNGKFDPFDVHLDGWSESMNQAIGDNEYDDVFEELHMKYRGKAKMAPELKLMMMVGGSGVMYHLTTSMFRQSGVPGLEQVMRQNPGLARKVAHATANTMQQNEAARNGGGGGLFGSLMNMFGGGGGNMGGMPSGGVAGSGLGPQQQQQQQPYVQQQQSGGPPPPPVSVMRGPRDVNDILKDLHRDAFPPPPAMSSSRNSHNHRIEIVSNASESDLGDLRDDPLIADLANEVQAVRQPAKRGGGRGGGRRKASVV